MPMSKNDYCYFTEVENVNGHGLALVNLQPSYVVRPQVPSHPSLWGLL